MSFFTLTAAHNTSVFHNTNSYKLKIIIFTDQNLNSMKLYFYLIIIFTAELFAQESYFYKGYDYGSQALYNPLYAIVNGGFDVLQLGERRDISKVYFAQGAKNVWNNIKDPFSTIKKYGWKKFINDEIIPFSFNIENMQFWPNYSLHLIGGGMTYVAMEEWYRHNNFSSPEILGAATFLALGFINEAVENGNYEGYTVDPIADIYLFNIGGVLLFSSQSVRKFFSEELNLSDWSMQPSYLISRNEVHNIGQYFSIKWKLPFSEKFHLFYCFGTNGVLGLSYKYEDGTALSFGVGARASDLVVVDPATNKKTANLNGLLGIYYDKNNSLLASLVFNFKSDMMQYKKRNILNYIANLNIYPGIIKIGSFSPGIWAALKQDKEFIFGLSINLLPIGIAQTIK